MAPDAAYRHRNSPPPPDPRCVARGSLGLWTHHQVFGAKEAIESEGIRTKTKTYPLSLNPIENWWLKELIVDKLSRGVLLQHVGCFPLYRPPLRSFCPQNWGTTFALPCLATIAKLKQKRPTSTVWSRRTAPAPWCCTTHHLGRRSTRAPPRLRYPQAEAPLHCAPSLPSAVDQGEHNEITSSLRCRRANPDRKPWAIVLMVASPMSSDGDATGRPVLRRLVIYSQPSNLKPTVLIRSWNTPSPGSISALHHRFNGYRLMKSRTL
jgi:hypothetical protein